MSNESDDVSRIYAKIRALAEGTSAHVSAADLPDTEAAVALAPSILKIPVRTPTLPPATHTNAYAIGDQRIVLVDLGAWSPAIVSAIEAALAAWRGTTARVVAVLATHHHGDHTGGLAQAADHWGVPVLGHPKTKARAPQLAPWRAIEGGELPLVDDTWRVLHTPGHADGHLCLDHPASRTTIVGDMVAGEGTILIDPSDGDLAAYLASLAALAALGQRQLLPAHGPAIIDGLAKLAAYRAHRLDRERRVVDALAKAAAGEVRSLPLARLLAEVYADTPRALWPLAERALLSHLLKLEGEGRAAADAMAPGHWQLAGGYATPGA